MEPAFGLVSTEFSVDLHPSGLRDVSRSIKQIMLAQVLSYSKEYSGVVMGYRDARILSSTAPVHTFFPYSHVKVAAKLLILKLSENQIIGKAQHPLLYVLLPLHPCTCLGWSTMLQSWPSCIKNRHIPLSPATAFLRVTCTIISYEEQACLFVSVPYTTSCLSLEQAGLVTNVAVGCRAVSPLFGISHCAHMILVRHF